MAKLRFRGIELGAVIAGLRRLGATSSFVPGYHATRSENESDRVGQCDMDPDNGSQTMFTHS
jgi:hypothetical protein